MGKYLSKSEAQIAATQYAAGFVKTIHEPGGQPEARGAGAKFYLEGHADARVSPRANLKDRVLTGTDEDNKLFCALTHDSEESEAGRPFVTEMRVIAAAIMADPGEDPKLAVPRIYRALMGGAEQLINSQEEKQRAAAIVDEMVARGLAVKVG